jgi:dephospho-CoA kinase
MSPNAPLPPPPRPRILGLLGGIAAGKSAAARLLAGPDGVVLAADALAHEVLDTPEVQAKVRARFGARALGPDGRVDRALVARAVFEPTHGPALRAELESWTHPLVRARIMARLDAARDAGVPRVVLDVPLLLENDAEHGLARLCDVLVFVDVPDDERDRRAQRERGWPRGEVFRREQAQLALDEKKRRAHHVLPNHQGLAELERAVQELLARL